MMSLTFGLFTQVSDSGSQGPLVVSSPSRSKLGLLLYMRAHVRERVNLCMCSNLSFSDFLFNKKISVYLVIKCKLLNELTS